MLHILSSSKCSPEKGSWFAIPFIPVFFPADQPTFLLYLELLFKIGFCEVFQQRIFHLLTYSHFDTFRFNIAMPDFFFYQEVKDNHKKSAVHNNSHNSHSAQIFTRLTLLIDYSLFSLPLVYFSQKASLCLTFHLYVLLFPNT